MQLPASERDAHWQGIEKGAVVLRYRVLLELHEIGSQPRPGCSARQQADLSICWCMPMEGGHHATFTGTQVCEVSLDAV